jgi:hypothetical protein
VHRDRLPTPDRLRGSVMCVRVTSLAWGVDPKLQLPEEANLPPGDYVAQFNRGNYELEDRGYLIAQQFRIESDQETQIEVPAKSLVWRTLRFTEPPTDEPMTCVRYSLRDVRGREIVNDLVLKAPKVPHLELELGLDPGTYELVASNDAYRRATATLEMRSPSSETIEIELR